MSSTVTLHHLMVALVFILILVLLLIISVLVLSYVKYISISNRRSWAQLIEQRIMMTVVERHQSIQSDERLVPLLEKKSFKLLFLELIISSTRHFSGAALLELSKLFQEIDAQGDAFNTLSKSNRIRFISDSIQGLSDMKHTHIVPELENYLQDPNPQVYLEAQYALVQLRGFKGLQFLHDLPHLLSDWQQMRLLASIKVVPDQSVGSIKRWLHNQNDTVIIFTLRLIRKFQLLELYQDIVALPFHHNPKVRIQIVKALQALENDSTFTTLIQFFEKEILSVQKEILKVFKISKNKKTVDFLKVQLLENTSSELQLIAADALLDLGETPYLESLKTTAPHPISLIIKHVLRDQL